MTDEPDLIHPLFAEVAPAKAEVSEAGAFEAAVAALLVDADKW